MTREDDKRRCKILDAALAVFVRFGFRKTSMDEIARSAELSRQGLYLHFATKEGLFVATVEHVLETSLAEAAAKLRDDSSPVEERLLGGFDAWMGRFLGMGLGVASSDLMETSHDLVGPKVAAYEELFVDAVGRTIRASGLLAAYKGAGLTARQLADTLYATARGFKYGAKDRGEFVQGMTIALRALCAPLAESK